MTRPNVVNVVGGLGNQLFQYLFGLALEDRTGRPTLFDVSDFDWYDLHGGLKIEEYFEVELPRAAPSQIPLYARNAFLKKALGRLGPLSLVRSDDNYRLPERPAPGPAAYFRGYWQDPDYGAGMMARIRRTLAFRPPVADAAETAWARLAPPADAACIQIRRGDYAALPPGAPQYLLPLDYFSRAMDAMNAAAGTTTFYVFSDDIAGVGRDLSSRHELVFVDPAISPSAGTDLCLMTRFAHHIMSNSTFGWWAAALRRDEGATIAPRPWLNPRWTGPQNLAPYLPPDWRRLDALS